MGEKLLSDDVKTLKMPPPRVAALMRMATFASVGTAAVLIIIKFYAWHVTGSLSMLATLVDSLLDILASLLSFFAVRHALTPADAEHRFGHGKAEPLAALGQAAFISGSAIFVIIEVVERLISPKPLVSGEVGIVVMLISILATAILVTFQRYVVKKSGSLAIQADWLHYRGDLLMNLSVLIALLLSMQFGWLLADPIFGFGIALFVLWSAWTIGRTALSMLMDRELPDSDRREIKEVILANKEVLGFHDLRTRSSGQQLFIQCHIEMDGALSLWEAHEVADRIEGQLAGAFPGAEVILHEDPYLQKN